MYGSGYMMKRTRRSRTSTSPRRSSRWPGAPGDAAALRQREPPLVVAQIVARGVLPLVVAPDRHVGRRATRPSRRRSGDRRPPVCEVGVGGDRPASARTKDSARPDVTVDAGRRRAGRPARPCRRRPRTRRARFPPAERRTPRNRPADVPTWYGVRLAGHQPVQPHLLEGTRRWRSDGAWSRAPSRARRIAFRPVAHRGAVPAPVERHRARPGVREVHLVRRFVQDRRGGWKMAASSGSRRRRAAAASGWPKPAAAPAPRRSGSAALSALPQEVVRQNQRDHRLDDRHGARQHAGIVAAAPLDGRVVAVSRRRSPARAGWWRSA